MLIESEKSSGWKSEIWIVALEVSKHFQNVFKGLGGQEMSGICVLL